MRHSLRLHRGGEAACTEAGNKRATEKRGYWIEEKGDLGILGPLLPRKESTTRSASSVVERKARVSNMTPFHVSAVLLMAFIASVSASNQSESSRLIWNRYLDPDANLPTPKIIAKYGYPAEAHTVKTADGYLLTMHRIPHSNKGKPADGRPRPPIFLQHGLLGSSADWIIRGPHKALAYLLSDSGYDVWMGNARGNTYSRSHVTLDSSQQKFWDFSFHEMGYYDLPAEINHVLNVTNQTDLIYVGHSMGTTMFYVLASMRPEYTPKIRAMFSLAPVAFMARVKSPIRFLAPFAEDIDFVLNFLGDGEFLPQNKIIKFLSRYGCELATIEKEICENIIFAIVGFDSSQFNQALLPIVLGHFPAGSSTKTVLHYAQEIRSGKFQMYDYGAEKNMKRYGTSKAPEYDLNAIQVPISLHYSLNDWLANVDDVKLLYHRLPNTIGKYRVSLPQFNHLDFLWANDIEKLLFNNLLYLINKEASRNSTDSRL